jgi:hypothetical protein
MRRTPKLRAGQEQELGSKQIKFIFAANEAPAFT